MIVAMWIAIGILAFNAIPLEIWIFSRLILWGFHNHKLAKSRCLEVEAIAAAKLEAMKAMAIREAQESASIYVIDSKKGNGA